MKRSLIFKMKIDNAIAPYQSRTNGILSAAKQEKITELFKFLPKPGDD